MVQGQLRSFLSLVALICLIGGSFATALGLIKIEGDPGEQPITDEEYIVPAAVGNTLCVIFLIWLTATITTRSTAYKLIVILVLILGLIGEIYTTFYFTTTPAIYATYLLVVVNFLIRTFYVLEYVQDTWSPVSWNDYVGAPRVSHNSYSNTPSIEKKLESEKKGDLTEPQKEVAKKAREKLNESINILKADAKGYTGSSIGDADRIIKKEASTGKSAEEIHKVAKSLLKYKDGTAYTGAGRRA